MTHSLLLRLCALASLASLAVASADVNTAVTVRPSPCGQRAPSDPRRIQADGERIIAGYTPSVGLSVAGIVLYGASTLALWWMWARTGRKLYMLTLNISMASASRISLSRSNRG